MLETQFAPDARALKPVADAEKIAAIVTAVVRAAEAWELSNA